MKKSKIDFDASVGILQKHIESAQGGVSKDLCILMKKILNEGNARGIRYMLAYYGLDGSVGSTLESIGEQMAGGLTRERVRQIIDTVLGYLKHLEVGAQCLPYKNTVTKFYNLINNSGASFIKLKELESDDYFRNFSSDAKGFIAFLNDAGIKQVVYRGENYIYSEKLSRKEAISLIQDGNKRLRREKTLKKIDLMSKTVTYVPTATRNMLLAYSKEKDIALNRLYENILLSFIKKQPYKCCKDFEKTQSWKARQGKAQWSQVGIYISRDVFDSVKKQVELLDNEVSNMAFISQAFVWFSNNSNELSN